MTAILAEPLAAVSRDKRCVPGSVQHLCCEYRKSCERQKTKRCTRRDARFFAQAGDNNCQLPDDCHLC